MNIISTRYLNPRTYYFIMQISSTFETNFRSYLETKGLNIKSINIYLEYFNKYINTYPELNQKNLDTFLKYNQSSPARAAIKNLLKSILRIDINQIDKTEIASLDVTPITGKKDKNIPKFMQKSDINRLELGITDEQIRLMVLIQFYAGLRVSELMGISYNSLKKEDYDKGKENKFQSIRISSDSAKFGKERIAYIPTDIYVNILKWLKDKITKDERMNKIFDKTKSIWGIKERRYTDRLSYWSKKILGESYNSQALRHGRGTDLILNEGEPIEFVKEYLGHATINSTQIYTHLSNKNIKDELERIRKDSHD